MWAVINNLFFVLQYYNTKMLSGCSLFQTAEYLQHRDTNNNCLPSITRKPCYEVTRVSERGLLCNIIACGRKACSIARTVICCLITSNEHVPLSSKCDRKEDMIVVLGYFSFTVSLNLYTFLPCFIRALFSD